MPEAIFRFYEELNDFLTPKFRKRAFRSVLKGRQSVKDRIESLGVPHTEVDLILVNGKSVDFNYILRDGDQISVYPVFETLNIKNITRLREIPLRKTRFVADINIRDIVTLMRALGFDVYYDPLLSPAEIIRVSREEERIILTKSRKLLKFKDVTHGIFIRPGTVVQQTRGIVDFLTLRDAARPFSRCLRCNSTLIKVRKEDVIERIPPKTRAFCSEYSWCRRCDKIYWKGTHYTKIKRMVDWVLNE